jgi:hypothetical protein
MPLTNKKHAIEENNPDIYKQFFAKNDLVVSLPHMIRFGNEL